MYEPSATVLIVDDHRLTAELTGMALEAAGFVLIEEDGPAALAVLAGGAAIRAVVWDMNMHGMDGLALLDALRQAGFTQPFILLTGEDETAQLARHPGLDTVMTKDETVEEALPDLDLQIPLKTLNNKWETSNRLLQAFRSEYLTAAADYRTLRAAGDAAQCLASLHALKGAASMLGATGCPRRSPAWRLRSPGRMTWRTGRPSPARCRKCWTASRSVEAYPYRTQGSPTGSTSRPATSL